MICGRAGFTSLVIDTAHRLDIPVSLMVPFGILLGSAGAGLLAGLVPGLGTVAAAGSSPTRRPRASNIRDRRRCTLTAIKRQDTVAVGHAASRAEGVERAE